MSTRKIYQRIEQLVNDAKQKIKEAQKLADENNLTFSYDFGFGINGTYHGSLENEDDWKSSDDQDDWISSKQCY